MNGRAKLAARGFRRGRGVGGTRHDAYAPRQKIAGPACCSGCGAVYDAGRWSWRARPNACASIVCPACRRIRDRFPAGVLRFEGDLGAREAEILGLLKNVEAREKRDHPLERLMSVRRAGGGLTVETTGLHLARCLAGALERAFHREAEIRFLREQDLVRVTWRAAE
jgi:hypothetical protein